MWLRLILACVAAPALVILALALFCLFLGLAEASAMAVIR